MKMKGNFAAPLLAIAMTAAAHAEQVPSTQAYHLPGQFAPVSSMPTTGVRFAAKERKAVALAQEWIQQPDYPVHGDDGRLVYLFGASMPTIVCQPLQICDLELQLGEKVKPGGVHVGDSVRWSITPAISGLEGAETTHVIIKPKDAGLDTTLMIATDRRTYHIRLKSDSKQYMPLVSFHYPDQQAAQWAALYAQQQQAQERETIPGTGQRLEDLDFGYGIDGPTRLQPVRVYNDGSKTVIEMPETMQYAEAPALLVLDERGDEQLVNYRLLGKRYIVDAVFDRAVLVAGVGRNQTRVRIERIEP